MQKNHCPKVTKNIIILIGFSILSLVFASPSETYSASIDTINLQGKIVRNDTGYEGLNVTPGSPSCVVDGAANDTCDFRIRYYSAASGGTLFLTEEFANKEIGQYNGAFNLSLGSDGSPTAGSYSSVDAMIAAEDTIYVEIGFDPAGGASYTETFTRMQIQATAFAIRAKYASEADTAFQFDTAANSTGYSTPSAGMVYYDTTDSTLKVYNGATWEDVGGGGTGSLWTDSTTFTYLTDTTDHFVLGSNSYTAIGADTYSTYVAGLASRAPLSFDMTAERLTLSGSAANTGLAVYSNYTSTGAWPVALFKAEDSGFDNVVVEIVQDGTGNLLSLVKGSTETFAFENEMTFFIRDRGTAPSTNTHRLYNVGGTLYWNGSALATGSGLWTDSGTITYLTDDDDDVIIGGTSALDAVFYFDVANGRLGIGTGTPSSALDIAGASSAISNSVGDIMISAEESVVIKAQNTDPNNLMEWQNSSGTILSLINQSGYAAIGSATGSTTAKLLVGANTTGVSQINLVSSVGVDVATPTSGDIWWNGTSLFFFNGTSNVDLLTGDNSTSEGFVRFVPTSAQVDSGNSVDSIWINKTGSGGNLLRFQDGGSDVFTIDDTGDISASGTMTFGGSGSIRYNNTDSVLEISNDGTNWIPLGTLAKTTVLSAEYQGAVLSADGSANTGSMTSDNEGTAASSMNYYEWSSSETSLNDYDVRVRLKLPPDFESWGTSGGITFNFATEATGTTNNKASFYIYEESSVSIDGTSADNASSSAGVWTTATIAGSGLTECVSSSDTCILLLKMFSANDSYTRVGDIEITYDRTL